MTHASGSPTTPPPYMDEAGWGVVQDHLALYLGSEGAEGHTVEGLPTLLLTTTGRRSGEPRTTPLIYARDGDRLLVVASLGGSPKPPQWYLNLSADARVHVQVATERFPALARTAGDDEKPRLWELATRVYPKYDVYQAASERVLPVVVLEPVGTGGS